jgi:hypothetical protein
VFEGIPSWAFVVVFVLQRYDFNKRMASQDWASHLSIANPSVSLKFCMSMYSMSDVSSKNPAVSSDFRHTNTSV